MAISVFPSTAVRGLLFFALIPLPLGRALAAAQETPAEQQAPPLAQTTPAQFDDLAARAAAARDQQDLPLAVQLYTQAEQLKPDWQEGWWYLGVLQYSANQYSGAIDAFTHLLQLVPTAVPAMALRGLCEFETGAYDDSLRDLEQAVAHGARTSRATNKSFATIWLNCSHVPAASSWRSINTISSPRVTSMRLT